ncbi:MAG TPA: hypothetical protein PLM78_00055 [Fervidobacterium sp.]|nr:hypothetical protein [Fervidobacterium sp.]
MKIYIVVLTVTNYKAVYPPSITISEPVMNEDSSEAKYNAPVATSLRL